MRFLLLLLVNYVTQYYLFHSIIVFIFIFVNIIVIIIIIFVLFLILLFDAPFVLLMFPPLLPNFFTVQHFYISCITCSSYFPSLCCFLRSYLYIAITQYVASWILRYFTDTLRCKISMSPTPLSNFQVSLVCLYFHAQVYMLSFHRWCEF